MDINQIKRKLEENGFYVGETDKTEVLHAGISSEKHEELDIDIIRTPFWTQIINGKIFIRYLSGQIEQTEYFDEITAYINFIKFKLPKAP